jgi:anthranilate synthase/aminodeoxychorismate synthase-like glutamine amidotransferase
MVLLIDNYDSFTYNLYQQLEARGARTHVAVHDGITVKEIKKLNPSRIIISPGPGRPEQSGICIEVIKYFHGRIPILGVCLGHECIGAVFGARVVHAQRIMHGTTSRIYHRSTHLFKGIQNPFYAARYHSLALHRVPEGFTLSAWDGRKEIMAITHNRYPLYGIQFHPESFMTEAGGTLIGNFLYAL